eukprot:TRINITY_DN19201_c0_g1_i3.p1 TRINITY_DN19201_c0_g1~~TRINITY_DN19201_c0_g1_i3.p1  ORF type:complete len:361 (+),score=-23.12 TRINITY_DN19201_c0_g1_i3:613-1695(+)
MRKLNTCKLFIEQIRQKSSLSNVQDNDCQHFFQAVNRNICFSDKYIIVQNKTMTICLMLNLLSGNVKILSFVLHQCVNYIYLIQVNQKYISVIVKICFIRMFTEIYFFCDNRVQLKIKYYICKILNLWWWQFQGFVFCVFSNFQFFVVRFNIKVQNKIYNFRFFQQFLFKQILLGRQVLLPQKLLLSLVRNQHFIVLVQCFFLSVFSNFKISGEVQYQYIKENLQQRIYSTILVEINFFRGTSIIPPKIIIISSQQLKLYCIGTFVDFDFCLFSYFKFIICIIQIINLFICCKFYLFFLNFRYLKKHCTSHDNNIKLKIYRILYKLSFNCQISFFQREHHFTKSKQSMHAKNASSQFRYI